MGRIASRICRQKGLRLRLLDSPDDICGECPNLTVQGCGLEGNSVAATDRQVLSLLGLSPGQELSAGECRGLLRERLTGESFEQLCGECSWRKKGLCSFEQLRERLASLDGTEGAGKGRKKEANT